MTLTSAVLMDDLKVYLGLGDDWDINRAGLVLDMTLERVASVVSPVPDEARPIVLDVAGRGYTNPQGVASETVGPFNTTFRAPGVYLTKRERADLRRLVGRGSAFTIDPYQAPE
jgi:hypothetical protein